MLSGNEQNKNSHSIGALLALFQKSKSGKQDFELGEIQDKNKEKEFQNENLMENKGNFFIKNIKIFSKNRRKQNSKTFKKTKKYFQKIEKS